jgi:molecular chaperone DnaJ
VYRLDTFDGFKEIRIEPGTQPGQVSTLKGLGVKKLHGTGRGDLLVTVNITVPTNLTDSQKALLAAFSTERGEEQPPLPQPDPKPGLFTPRASRAKKKRQR